VEEEEGKGEEEGREEEEEEGRREGGREGSRDLRSRPHGEDEGGKEGGKEEQDKETSGRAYFPPLDRFWRRRIPHLRKGTEMAGKRDGAQPPLGPSLLPSLPPFLLHRPPRDEEGGRGRREGREGAREGGGDGK
jgi:hypothetical protein